MSTVSALSGIWVSVYLSVCYSGWNALYSLFANRIVNTFCDSPVVYELPAPIVAGVLSTVPLYRNGSASQ
jgi:hypothetical protein